MNTATTVRMLQVVAMTVGISLLLWGTGLPTFFRLAEASSVTSASDTLSNSAPSQVSNHTISFTSPSGLLAGATITLTFPAGFTIPGALDFTDIDITASGSEQTLAASNGSGIWGVSTSSQTLTLTSPSNVGQASNTPFVIEIGTNATAGATGDQQITNPSATTSYGINIGGTMSDSGQVRVAIINEVVVSASVDTSLTFTVTGVAASSTVNSSPTTTSTTTSSTALAFGSLAVGVSKTLAQDLSVSTNATNGFVVTVQQSGNLQSSTGADIDGFINGSYTDTPTAWVGPSGLIVSENTYGHWGITSDDATTTRPNGQFGANQWIAASTTPTIILGHTGPSDGVTPGSGRARIGYQVQISALQEAGSDYSTTLRYIATPTF